ncbi:ABC transporter permease [Nakamurella antarctica]|uniref:ABC transporter permease n=1 Tax=Nakamurella antarctica TaxID=1902245 RepID=A0A3G8ZJA7_9ACTN|nr:ABC transporter permease [Nakamurella antarctica]AZI57452.1 ABC transporter permease [Nakamurella antarctica]
MSNSQGPEGRALHRPGQEHFVANVDETPLLATDSLDESRAPASLWMEAWKNLRKNPIFIVAAVLILFILFVVAFPSVFTKEDPRLGILSRSLGNPEPGHPFGFTKQGYDVFARTIYGARASVAVGALTTVLVVIVGGILGAIAGFFGGIVDTLISRLTDIFFAIPLILAAIVLLQLFKGGTTIYSVVLVLSAFGWPQVARITRGAVISVRNSEFVVASTALGNSRMKNLRKHVLPNSLAPVIVIATLSLGIYIVVEATLSFLGLGLPPSVMSWGNDISTAQASIRDQPMVLFYPAAALALTVLAFIMLGDAVREALDPKARKR